MSHHRGKPMTADGRINRTLCKMRLHKWEYLNPLWRKCQRCARQETFKLLGFKWEYYEGDDHWYAHFEKIADEERQR